MASYVGFGVEGVGAAKMDGCWFRYLECGDLSPPSRSDWSPPNTRGMECEWGIHGSRRR